MGVDPVTEALENEEESQLLTQQDEPEPSVHSGDMAKLSDDQSNSGSGSDQEDSDAPSKPRKKKGKKGETDSDEDPSASGS
jgi:hypothetical protein